jgi:hypothetical protein
VFDHILVHVGPSFLLSPPDAVDLDRWITNGNFSDYFTTGCRTDGGFTVILIERSEGVSTKQMQTSYSTSAGTAFITLDNVKVPVENTLGEVDAGLLVMLSNFNHERLVTCHSLSRTELYVGVRFRQSLIPNLWNCLAAACSIDG